jgi:hypothetical protein
MSDDLEQRLQDLLEERGSVAAATQGRTLDSIDRLPSRQRRSSWSTLLAAAAVLAVAVVGLASVYATRRSSEVAAPSPSRSPSSPSPTLQVRPVWAIDVPSHLDCDGPPSSIGEDVTLESAASSDEANVTPDAAFDAIRRDYSILPATGFTPTLVDDHWALQRYIVDGRSKVHIVATDQVPGIAPGNGWRIVGIRTCDPAEY